MRHLKFPFGLALAALSTLGLGAIRVPIGPDFFLLVVAASARGGSVVRAMVVGAFAGLIEDGLHNAPRLLGLHAFSKILIGYLLATIAMHAIVERPPAIATLLFGAAVLDGAIVFLLVWVLRGEPIPFATFEVLMCALLTGLLGMALRAAAELPWRSRRARPSESARKVLD